jgi:hypothetical protein
MIGAIGHVILLVVGIFISLLVGGETKGEDLTLQGWRNRLIHKSPSEMQKGALDVQLEVRRHHRTGVQA